MLVVRYSGTRTDYGRIGNGVCYLITGKRLLSPEYQCEEGTVHQASFSPILPKSVRVPGCPMPEYETGIKISDEELSQVKLKRSEFHGEWNYTTEMKAKRAR